MPDPTTAQPPTPDRLRAQIAEILGTEPEDIRDDQNLLQLGVDSLGLMRLVNAWRREGIRVPSRQLVAHPTLREWHELLEQLRAGARSEQIPAPDGAGAPDRG